jgi:hypothetical protein
MKIITGDEYGLIKCVNTQTMQVEAKYGTMEKKNEVLKIIKASEDSDLLYVLEKNRLYAIDWMTHDILYEKHQSNSSYVSMIMKEWDENKTIITSDMDSNLNYVTLNNEYLIDDEEINEFKINSPNIQGIHNLPNDKEIVCLFKNSPMQIFDISLNKINWKAKNVPHDELDLPVPIFDTCAACVNENQIYVTTAYGQIRFYDRKAKNKPILDKTVLMRKINKALLSECKNYLAITNNEGGVFMLDIRKSFCIWKSLKGNLGSVTDIRHLPGTNIMLTVGLDRHLRLFNYKTIESMPQIYLKNKLNTMCIFDSKQFLKNLEEKNKEEECLSDDEDEEEEEENEDDFQEENEEFDDEDENGNNDEEEFDDDGFEKIE